MALGEKITRAALAEPSITGLIMFGSQARRPEAGWWLADAESDWDFQVITRKPIVLFAPDWLKKEGLEPLVYAVRRATFGGVPKIGAIFPDGEVDFVVLPHGKLKLLRILTKLGFHRRSEMVRRNAQDLAMVMRSGRKFLKDDNGWERFYERLVNAVPDPRLNDSQVRTLAAGFVFDHTWIKRKIARGEFVAAQRMLHQSLIETNFRLLHELRLRRGQKSFREVRRVEQIASAEELEKIAIETAANKQALQAAIDKTARTITDLANGLLPEGWSWPL
jgi:hypothetical protein